ncbi:DUF554 domain-containing protein [Alicyclobacillus tolerans]|uniref:Membrane protein YqgA involved in biofilm formation n=2 Tax=Alicyclobacillus tolerans TaxID=90970 RepID=A0ABT9LUF6_9BACL|nr:MULTISPECIES: DUF554 domain-containing protein [Alicyclobacillus]MDP9727893.1 putative membrane protein YqgA involved in biofilm formation [Alicyclobacillus tengchongensis]QRF24534.1 DUF554 domain-containing protein [Alicyclobacillus sp. TC]SHK51498.1 hypothetical protein SAMN05443507_11559 [Alicyclobacillus montanus]
MFLIGTLVNSIAIILGSVLGVLLPRVPESMKTTIMQGLALCVALIGLGMALSDQKDILYLIISIVIGAIIGEWIDIENRLLRFGNWIEHKMHRLNQGPVSEAFVASTLLFCIGSMAIVGAIQNGISGDPQTLFAKSIIDGITSVIFASTLGFGVAFAAVSVFLYEGSIALLAHWVGKGMDNPAAISCMTATGGLLLIAIAINLYGLKKIAVGNLLPAIFIAVLLKIYYPSIIHVLHHHWI